MKKLKKTLMSASLVAMVMVMGVMMTACGKGGNGGLGINITIPTPESLGTEINQSQVAEFLSNATLDNWTGINAREDIATTYVNTLLFEMRTEMKVFENEILVTMNGYGRNNIEEPFENAYMGMFTDGVTTYAKLDSIKSQISGNFLTTYFDTDAIYWYLDTAQELDVTLSDHEAFYLNANETILSFVSETEEEGILTYQITILHFENQGDTKNLVKLESYFTVTEGAGILKGYVVLENQPTSFANNLPSAFNGKESWNDDWSAIEDDYM